MHPTITPTNVPTASPSDDPSASPSKQPSDGPSMTPTKTPSANPTTTNPTRAPLADGQTRPPTISPSTASPSLTPTTSPTNPTTDPSTALPTLHPTTVTPTTTATPTQNPIIILTTDYPTSSEPTSAIPGVIIGTNTVSSQRISITVTINTDTDIVDIELIGPSDRWFGVGFGQTSMEGYAIIASQTSSVLEYKLINGTDNIELTSMIAINSDMIDDGIRTIEIRRVRVGSGDHYTFPNSVGSIDIIWAYSSTGSTTFGYHGDISTGARGGIYLCYIYIFIQLLFIVTIAQILNQNMDVTRI